MSLRVGLGASQADLDVQGEIDFDFFEESDCTSTGIKSLSKSPEDCTALKPKDNCSDSVSLDGSCEQNLHLNEKLSPAENDLKSLKVPETSSSPNFHKPLITISCDDATGVVQKTTIETVIPTPFNYKDNKCGKISPSGLRNGKIILSPLLKSKLFLDENEISDDSSISSMSDSEGSLVSESEDSFELNESDSMTDVSPLASPYNCYTPTSCDPSVKSSQLTSPDGVKNARKEGVKFTEDVDKKECPKCNTINFHELANAINRLQITQNLQSVSMCDRKCKSPVITQNAKCRKSLSFTNAEVRKIDGDNQILLKKIMAQKNRASTHTVSSAQVRSSSAVNRQRHHRQIELENLALLKRLETTKPSRSLSRSHLLRDYDRRSSGVLSRASSRSSYPNSSSHTFHSSNQTSGRSSAISIKSSNSVSDHSSLTRSHSSSAAEKF